MSKHIVFKDDDKELIEQIENYKKAHGLSSFVATVRKLCEVAIQVEEIKH